MTVDFFLCIRLMWSLTCHVSNAVRKSLPLVLVVFPYIEVFGEPRIDPAGYDSFHVIDVPCATLEPFHVGGEVLHHAFTDGLFRAA